MSIAATSLVTSIPSSDLPRRSANYHPSIWGDRFIQYASDSMEVELYDKLTEEKIQVLKEEVRKRLNCTTNNPITKIELIDIIQRLGVNYHFESEINDVLLQIHNTYVQNGVIIKLELQDLRSIALVFRLLRQQGYHISPDVFNKLKDENGNFSERYSSDVEGLLSLFEATHLRVHGEHILDESFVFALNHLEMMMTTHLSPSLAAKIKHTLKHPLHKNIPRLEARHYISTYQEHPSHDETLLALAKLDFNKLQKLHQREVGIISKWWKDLDFTTKLPFARNRMVECYFWILGVFFEPCYSLARTITTKVTCIVSILDDIYDVYGTFEELQLFTTAIERWDISCMESLPEYMRYCYQALLDVYEEIEKEMMKQGRTFCVNYAKHEMKRLVRAYYEEAKWLNSNYTPTLEEYMGIAQISCAYPILTAISFIGMGSIANEEAFQWLANDPKIIRASTLICRLMDDVFEQKREHVASAVECYMKEEGVRKEEAIEELKREVVSAWKDINEECLGLKEVARPLLMRVLNLSRIMDVLYTEADGYTNSQGATKEYIASLLLNPFHL
ncbi:(-)-germacrene D synthase-like [Senna tora]|uniref:(-)-germacrene D synthase-like n=1 Tax=Senna tora TaxID=362788 RepID=A0A834TL46_9FABA|nr:(-)-germacrene D synthase-like [Senna tora]